MRKIIIIAVSFFISTCLYSKDFQSYRALKEKYIQLSGELFRNVQLAGLFRDSKTFVDALPLKDPGYILKLYDSVKTLPDFDLGQFISANFQIPGEKGDSLKLPAGESMDRHIENLWKYLVRQPEPENQFSTLIPLKQPYIVPGGRFREIYYWDSFFTILGLLADKRVEEAENMVSNFAYLLDKYKMIPNGNRVYYLTRSQPPFFSLMVDVICRYKKDFRWGLKYLKQLQSEYDFWMNGLKSISLKGEVSSERVVKLNGEIILNRYYDFDDRPREESFREDYELSLKVPESLRPSLLRNLRAAAESGWDFSSRWFKDGKTLLSIQTTDILPVDLNCLLYFLEERLSYFYALNDNKEESGIYRTRSSSRRDAINKIFWNEKEGFYFDYNWKTASHTNIYSLAAIYPLYFGIAKKENAPKVSIPLEKRFLMPGGLVTTLYETKQQWDSPNGWPPLQWIAVKGLREYNLNSLADKIKDRWLKLNSGVFKRTGRMLEKYNVKDLELFAGGGEYPLQDGFGWTNGVASALINNFDKLFLLNNPK